MKLEASSLEQYLKNLDTHSSHNNCYVISGNEPCLIYESLGLLKTYYNQKGYTAEENFDLATSSATNITEHVFSASLFDEKKIITIVARDSEANLKSFATKLLEYTIPKSVICIIQVFDQQKIGILNLLEQKFTLIFANHLTPSKTKQWAANKASQLGINITTRDLEKLCISTQHNLNACNNLLQCLQFTDNIKELLEQEELTFNMQQLKQAIVRSNVSLTKQILTSITKTEGLRFVPLIVWLLTKETEVVQLETGVKLEILRTLSSIDKNIKGYQVAESITQIGLLLTKVAILFNPTRRIYANN